MNKIYTILFCLSFMWSVFAFGYAGVVLWPNHPIVAVLCFVAVCTGLLGFVYQTLCGQRPVKRKVSLVRILFSVFLALVFAYMLWRGVFNPVGLIFAIAVLMWGATEIVGTIIHAQKP